MSKRSRNRQMEGKSLKGNGRVHETYCQSLFLRMSQRSTETLFEGAGGTHFRGGHNEGRPRVLLQEGRLQYSTVFFPPSSLILTQRWRQPKTRRKLLLLLLLLLNHRGEKKGGKEQGQSGEKAAAAAAAAAAPGQGGGKGEGKRRGEIQGKNAVYDKKSRITWWVFLPKRL